MALDRRGYLQIPQGTEGFYLDEAYRHRMLTTEVEQLLFRWGYLPAQTPVFDYYDAYAALLSEEEARKIYRLIDRDGDLLMLRWDITLFLAKQMGMILREDDLPVRVCYADTILRHQNREDISKNEFFQTGAELIGTNTLDADLEVILLLRRALQQIGVPLYYIHIGSRALFNASFGRMPKTAQQRLRRAIVLRDMQTLSTVSSERGVPAARISALRQVFSFIGDSQELERLAGALQSALLESELQQIQRLQQLHATLGRADETAPYRIDLSEIGSQSYHTGVVFQAYVDGLDTSIAAGGRYDGLYGTFGLDVPAVGFSIMLRKLQDDTDVDARFVPPVAEQAAGDDFVQRFRDAENRRRDGGSVVL
ncbi:MAG: ATP phosphoribosyltransferase regulatory subunit [Spirochaetaceae bacterium]|nr:MAG: ATP phosphoribosyltransferase regulatory subunit [Spirochaetaceae bacterium]